MIKETVKLSNVRQAPRKVRLTASLIKGLPVDRAEAELTMLSRRAAGPVLKLLRSAVANIKSKNPQTDLTQLKVSEVRVDKGIMLKRFLPRARGMATPIQKKSSHVILTLVTDETIKPVYKIKPKTKEAKVKPTGADKNKETKAVKQTGKKPEIKKEATSETAGRQDKGLLKKIFRRKSV